MKNPLPSTRRYSIMISPPSFFTYQPFEDYEKELLNCWIMASKVFQSFDSTYENRKITIKTDWRKIKNQFKDSIEAPGELLISVVGNHECLDELSDFFTIRFLEMMFITMNISTPGSINMYDTELKNLNQDSDPYNKNWKISLGSSPFETFWETSGDLRNWPKVQFLPLNEVVSWYRKLKILFKQRASSNIERCFNALINYCQGNGFSPADFIWITHSLEALYDTPKEGIVTSLKNRIFLFLGTPDSHSKELRKKIGELYDFRSNFVHGSMEIARAPFFENLDQELWNYMNEIHKLSDFGIMLLLSSVQKIINENANSLKFYEVFETGEK
ncbi:MAG: hypothetical protein ABJG78_00405 [Cyclobacteriaceae bacterium]